MFRVLHRFVGEAYGKPIYNENLYNVLRDVFQHLVKTYEGIELNEQALCTDLLFAIKDCWYQTVYLLSEIEEQLFSCIDKEVPLNEFKFTVYEDTEFFDELNKKFANNTYLIKE